MLFTVLISAKMGRITHLAAQSQWQKLKSFGNVHRTEKPVDTLYVTMQVCCLPNLKA